MKARIREPGDPEGLGSNRGGTWPRRPVFSAASMRGRADAWIDHLNL